MKYIWTKVKCCPRKSRCIGWSTISIATMSKLDTRKLRHCKIISVFFNVLDSNQLIKQLKHKLRAVEISWSLCCMFLCNYSNVQLKPQIKPFLWKSSATTLSVTYSQWHIDFVEHISKPSRWAASSAVHVNHILLKLQCNVQRPRHA